ncbi:hypothetical protein GALL_15980 [mine drainage metagenome]|uniref:Uncharacterized protein n=1 Tax=mine drainage metagenome TaxID=410659 RepID=A0A1J5U1U8_9ZZZZ
MMSLVACSDDGKQLSIAPQHWKEADIRIETHPNPPLAGMSEIVVIVTGPRGRPVQDLTVSLRGNDSMQWVQAIQDGNIGVYRRAIDIGEGESIALQVQLQQGVDKTVLLFPLKLAKS